VAYAAPPRDDAIMSILAKVWAILLPFERQRAVLVLALMLAATVLEMLSVGLVVPVLAFMTSDASALPPTFRRLVDWLGDPTSSRAVLIVLTHLVVIFSLKSAFVLCVAYWQARYVRSVQANVSQRLFTVLLAQPWTFHLQRNSAALLHAVEESQAFSLTCTCLLQIVSEILVGLGLLALLLWYEPVGATIVAATLLLAVWLLNRTVRARSRHWAAALNHHRQQLRHQMQQGLGGIKEVKMYGCEQEFAHEFRTHTNATARMATLQWFVEQLPRPSFEMLAVVTLLLLTAAMTWHGAPVHSLLPILGLYATVAFRMLPSINQATIAAQRLRNAEPMITSLERHLALERSLPAPGPAMLVPFRNQIRLEHVSFRYAGGDDDILHDVNVSIPHGAAVGFIGGSGAGKSTLVDVLLGLLPPSSGRVTVDGFDVQDNVRGWQEIVGYVPQSIYLVDASIRRNVAFGVPEHVIDDEAVARSLTAARLDDFVRGLPDGVETVVGERGVRLSGGQRQRIAIARALYNDPQVLVLDEATSALDTDTERDVMAAVEALHGTKTLIIVAHRLSTVAQCDVLHRVEGGRIVRSGAFAEVVGAGSGDASA
jgi:ABC-type multidrug transport system fused ATPase/permease subunit